MDKKELFTKVIKKNEGLIFKVAILYTNSLQDREDLSQEIVFQLWKSFDSFNEQSKLSTWMYRVALNTAIYNLKQSKKRIETTAIELETMQFADVLDKTEEERIKLLYEHVQRLNLLEKGIILLYLEGKSHVEIASIIGITTSNVGTKISRIREKIKSQITKKR
ncbi:RNA polymerase sigma-70 factor (ECF subfamily) [Gelidibacter algens]|jgi:RNA polymerase sigma-70 factor (ECF subfamily)|uniref:RNA polymerase sigma-70 factor (ECF subfamily) n=1 Tax=Gelidibacter algens TaxID=49280 RepID=A0A1A7QZE4_9FLAO|nr:sigma-70 family RNA polymerase sigma factor [Gelidibacter algens]OBX25385.1 RNA polymerase subunit sigma-70 [Gelidibacter algens]RAJ24721.1 RNA polymerase sigma-70 factor (ECF subfamily) [Gelidibacter algens]